MNEPRLNFWPSASNGSSATSILRVLEPVAQRGERRIGVVVDRRRRLPCTGDAAGGGHVALDRLQRRVEHLHVGDPHDLDVEQLAEGPAGVVVRIALRIVRRPVPDSRAACRRCGCRAGPCAARRCRPGTSASRARLGLVRGLLLCPAPAPARPTRSRRCRSPPAASLVVSRAADASCPGTVTVNGAVAREISQPCSCRMRSRSACGPGRGSSPGKTYAAGPSVFGFRIERLLFR